MPFRFSSRVRAFSDHRSNGQKSKFLQVRRCPLRSVPSRNISAVKFGPTRSGTNSSKCRERQKDQPVIGLAQPLLIYLVRWRRRHNHKKNRKSLGGETNK